MTSTNLSRREQTRIRRALRRRRQLRLGAAAALGSLAVAGVSGAALGPTGANLRTTAGIQLVNLVEPLLTDDTDAAQGSAAGPDQGPATDNAPDPQTTAGAADTDTARAGGGAGRQAPEQPEPAAKAVADAAERSAAAERNAAADAAAQEAAEEAARAVPLDDPAAAKAYAASALPARGWDTAQMTCLDKLWTKESEWLTSAVNPSSGAYGIAQSLPAEKMAVAGADWKVSYATQINWGLDYIASRYGSPCTALGFHYANNWY